MPARPKNKNIYKALSKFLGTFQILVDSYYIFFMIPLNVYGGTVVHTINGLIFPCIIGSELYYRMRCPLTVWRNRLRKIWHPRFEHEDSALATTIHKLGFRKPHLWQVQIAGIIFAILTTASFFA